MKGRMNRGVTPKESQPVRRNNSKVENEAEERKSGGKVHGEGAKHHAGRKPRKDGGRLLSAAAHGTPPKGHKAKSGSC